MVSHDRHKPGGQEAGDGAGVYVRPAADAVALVALARASLDLWAPSA